MCAPRPRFPAFRVPSTRPTGLLAPPAARTTAAAARSFGHLPAAQRPLARARRSGGALRGARQAQLILPDHRRDDDTAARATEARAVAEHRQALRGVPRPLRVPVRVRRPRPAACPPAACHPRTFAVPPSRCKPLSRPCVPRCFLCSYKLYVASRGNLALAGTALSVLVPLYYLATRVILS